MRLQIRKLSSHDIHIPLCNKLPCILPINLSINLHFAHLPGYEQVEDVTADRPHVSPWTSEPQSGFLPVRRAYRACNTRRSQTEDTLPPCL